MELSYSFAVLRYIHDPVTQEFANVGVVVYSKYRRYLNAICTTNYRRIASMFGSIDGERFRQTTRQIQERLNSIGGDLSTELPFESGQSLDVMLARVLPNDDSGFQFSRPGTGIADDLSKTLKELFVRFVERYSSKQAAAPRDDDDVWRVYRDPLDRRMVTQHLHPKLIVAPNYDYEFQHSWKNERWHVYEPVSFDLLEATAILDKANRWLGRVSTLTDSREKFKIHILMGEPRDTALKSSFVKAQNILHKIPGQHELISENEAEQFAEELAAEIRDHELRR
jgi:hypothetical protein